MKRLTLIAISLTFTALLGLSTAAQQTAPKVNHALEANVTASSTYDNRFSPRQAANGDKTGAQWGVLGAEAVGGWNDRTRDVFPDDLELQFDSPKEIDEVVVYSLRQQVVNEPGAPPAEPTEGETSVYAIQDATVEGFDGRNWIPLASFSNNALVIRRLTFAPFTTRNLRLRVTRAPLFSRTVELEARGRVL